MAVLPCARGAFGIAGCGQLTLGLLHLSDLHRSESDPISNEELLSTLLADRDRYIHEDPPVPLPTAIVVSGDVIQGVPLGHPAPEIEIEAQYKTAHEFLAQLCDEFVESDRSRVIIVPGNHDVDWATARLAMGPVPDERLPATVGPRAFGPEKDLRWCWRERRAYQITDAAVYEQRFDRYRRFVSAFYDGVDLPFVYRAGEYYQLFELFDGRVAVAAFNSCQGNDCFAFHGAIPESAIARAHMELRDRGPRYDLRMAIWHHNVDGTPYQTDYMDVATVYKLIGRGFGLGLHGHQHWSHGVHRYIHLPDALPMAVVSAGSLCAGPADLPPGVNRQYNVIGLKDDLTGARVHVREMAIATVFAPAQRTQLGGTSYVDLDWGGPPAHTVAGAGRASRDSSVVLEAERAFSEARYDDVVRLLSPVDREPGSYARTIMTRAFLEGAQWDRIVEELRAPTTSDELTLLVRALAEAGRSDEAISIAEGLGPDLGVPPPNVTELVQWVKSVQALRS